jgi:hypothetical protein
VLADGSLVGQPEDGAIGALAGHLEHERSQRGDEHRRRGDVGDVERVVDLEALVLDVDRARTGQRLVEHVEVGPHGRQRLLVGETEHLFDDPVVRDAEPEAQTPEAGGLGGQGLLGERDRVPRLHGYDGRADLDAARLGGHERHRGEGVELVGDLRDPDRREAGFLRPAGVAQHPLDLAGVPPPLRTDHQADAHAVGPPRRRDENLLLPAQ